MKLNFWQWLGVALLVLGVLMYLMRETTPVANPPAAVDNAVTSSTSPTTATTTSTTPTTNR